MYRNVVRYVMHCRECQRRKSVPQRPPGRLVPIPPAIAPFHRIGIDLLGRFPKSAYGNKWIIVCTDYSTRYAITKALPTAEVDEIAKFLLEEIVLRHGAPRVIITDRGAVFRSRLISSLVDLCNIDHRFTTAYHPQTNGLTERFNKTLADMLSMYVDVEQKNWDEILPFVTFAYNTAKQETTGFTPFYLLHGREAETTLDTMLPFCPNDFDDNNITKIAARAEESRQLARVHTLRAQDKDRRRYDFKHRMVSYAPGDLVLRRLSAVTYAVQDFDPASRKRKLREVVHVLRMKPYHDPAEQIETEDIPPKESYKGPITRSRIKTLEQNDSGPLPQKSSHVEYTTDEEDMIAYAMGEEIESPKNGCTLGESKKDIHKLKTNGDFCLLSEDDFNECLPVYDNKEVGIDGVEAEAQLITNEDFKFATTTAEHFITQNPELEATRGLLGTDHVILNHCQVTWTTPELAPRSPNYRTTPTGGRFKSRQIQRVSPTRRIFCGTGLELVTRQATVRYLYYSSTVATFTS
ncbi:retrovirus-related Pol polyprotein from transposon 412 [Trichonephila clavipes]|nr:retrovirus-related Pol polyprotein from transposon 412 [Trichonephila clavipes]